MLKRYIIKVNSGIKYYSVTAAALKLPKEPQIKLITAKRTEYKFRIQKK